jgi:hypothetical protein
LYSLQSGCDEFNKPVFDSADIILATVAAYGCPTGLSDDEILSRLMTLNLERTKQS